MQGRKRRPSPACSAESRILEAWLRGETSPEVEIFLVHAASCPRCQRRMEIAFDLERNLAPRLNGVPEITPTVAEARLLRRTAREEMRRLSTSPRKRSPALRQPSLWMAAAMAVILAAGGLFLLTRPGRLEVFRSGRGILDPSLSPQGALGEKPSVFRWDAFPGAAFYVFELIDGDLELLVRSERSPERTFILPRDIQEALRTGRPYLWTVIAYDRDFSEVEERSASFFIE